MGARVIGPELAKVVTKVWMDSEFDSSSPSGPKVQRMVEIDAKYQAQTAATDSANPDRDTGEDSTREAKTRIDRGFFADETSLNMEDYIVLDYCFESVTDPEQAAASSLSGAIHRAMEAGRR